MLEIKPIYNTGTISFVESPEKISLKKIDSSFVKDPEGVIPNGIYKVFKHEKGKQKFLLFFFTIILIGLIITSALLSTTFFNKVNHFWFVPLFVAISLTIWKIVSIILDMKHLKQSIIMYRESLLAGSRLTPPFITSLYLKLFKVQAKQNWIVIAFLFYGTLFTLLFWWLKDVNWWIFTFKDWINKLTNNPELIGFISIMIMIFVLVFHIYFTVYRKKRIIDIQSFFGNEVISQTEVDEVLKHKNKIYRRVFFLSILIILVFPFIIWIIYKKLIKK